MDISNEKFFAIKIMKENQVNTQNKIENVIREIQTLSDIDHENIVEIEYINIDGIYKKRDGRVIKVIYYIMKIAEYGELYNFLQFTPIFSEKLARFYFKQLINGRKKYLFLPYKSILIASPKNCRISKNKLFLSLL